MMRVLQTLAACTLNGYATWLKKKEATMGFEPMMRVLQTLALPLGHVALPDFRTDHILIETA